MDMFFKLFPQLLYQPNGKRASAIFKIYPFQAENIPNIFFKILLPPFIKKFTSFVHYRIKLKRALTSKASARARKPSNSTRFIFLTSGSVSLIFRAVTKRPRQLLSSIVVEGER